MAKPVLFIVDDEPQVLNAVERDLRRHFETEENPRGAVASDLMSTSPATIEPSLLAFEALEAFQNYPRKIGEMPVAFRRLEAVRTSSMLDALKSTTNEVRDAFFPGNIEFAEDFAKGRFENKGPSSYDHFFCSELVAYTLMKMDLLSDKKVPNYYEPKSYSLKNTHGIPLIHGASLGEEIWVDRLSDT